MGGGCSGAVAGDGGGGGGEGGERVARVVVLDSNKSFGGASSFLGGKEEMRAVRAVGMEACGRCEGRARRGGRNGRWLCWGRCGCVGVDGRVLVRTGGLVGSGCSGGGVGVGSEGRARRCVGGGVGA